MSNHNILPIPPPPPPDPFDDISDELRRLKDASRVGDLESFQRHFTSAWLGKNPDQRHPISVFKGCLSIAQQNRHFPIMSCILSHGFQIEPSAFGYAVKDKDYDVLILFLDHGYAINTPLGPNTAPAIVNALDDKNLTAWLLERGADPNARCYFDITPMSEAVLHAPLEVIKFLFDNGGSVEYGQLLHNAAQRLKPDRREVVELVLSQNPPIDNIMYQHQPNSYWWHLPLGIGTPLHYAAEIGDVGVVKMLLERGAHPRTKDPRGRTPYDRAKAAGHVEIANLLANTVPTGPLNTFGEENSLEEYLKQRNELNRSLARRDSDESSLSGNSRASVNTD